MTEVPPLLAFVVILGPPFLFGLGVGWWLRGRRTTVAHPGTAVENPSGAASRTSTGPTPLEKHLRRENRRAVRLGKFADSTGDHQALQLTLDGHVVPIDCLWDRGEGRSRSRDTQPDWGEWCAMNRREPEPADRRCKMQLCGQADAYLQAAGAAIRVADSHPEKDGVGVAKRCIEAALRRVAALEALAT
ncbi:MAG: hypothetical protein OXG47_05140 [bacterium]|nr:hypothetical protein [bacterium]